MGKFCLKCGAQAVDDTSLFCAICGTQLPVTIAENSGNDWQNFDAMPEWKDDNISIEEGDAAHRIKPEKTSKIKKRRKNMVLIIVVSGVLFSIIFLGIILPPKDNLFTTILPLKDNSSNSSSSILTGGPVSNLPPVSLKTTPTPRQTSTPRPTSISNKTLTQTPVPVDTIVPGILKIPIGEGASDGITSVLVYSAKKTSRYSYSDTSNKNRTETAPQGKSFVIVDVGIKNVGAPYLAVNSTPFSITDSNSFKYDPSLSYNGTDGLRVQQLYLNQVSGGKILFIIPASSKELRLQYDFGNLATGPNLAEWPVK